MDLILLAKLSKLINIQCTINELNFAKIKREISLIADRRERILCNPQSLSAVQGEMLMAGEQNIRALRGLHQQMKRANRKMAQQKLNLQQAKAKADLISRLEETGVRQRRLKRQQHRDSEIIDLVFKGAINRRE